MDIVILANFTGDFSDTDNTRFLYIARMLSNEGHSVEFVTSRFFHGGKCFRQQPVIDGIKVTLLDEPGYPKNICLKRFYSHYVWGQNVKKYLNSRKKPDVLFSSVPSLTGPLNAAKYCNKNGVKFVIDVNDLWPEAFQMVFDVPVVSNIIFAPFTLYANAIYKRADEIFGVSQSYIDRALSVNKRCREGHAVFIGTDLKTFDTNAERNKVTDKPDGELWLGYCGTLGASYDLITVIDALAILKNENKKVPKFIVMGDGARKTELQNYAKAKQVETLFTGFLPYDRMCGMLCACDIVVNPIKGKSAASIINKHADYAACGRPVINTQDSPEYIKLVEDYKMGFNVENSNAKEFALRLEQMLGSSELRKEMGKRARKCAEEKFDRKRNYSLVSEDLAK